NTLGGTDCLWFSGLASPEHDAPTNGQKSVPRAASPAGKALARSLGGRRRPPKILTIGRKQQTPRRRPPFTGAPNGPGVNPRGQGPRGYRSAARRLPAFEARDAGGVTPSRLR